MKNASRGARIVGAVVLSLSLGSMGVALMSFAAAGGYSITANQPTFGPFSIGISGTAGGNPIVGKCKDQHIGVLTWDATNGNLPTPEPVTLTNFSCNDSTKILTTKWSASHSYSGTGNYTIK